MGLPHRRWTSRRDRTILAQGKRRAALGTHPHRTLASWRDAVNFPQSLVPSASILRLGELTATEMCIRDSFAPMEQNPVRVAHKGSDMLILPVFLRKVSSFAEISRFRTIAVCCAGLLALCLAAHAQEPAPATPPPTTTPATAPAPATTPAATPLSLIHISTSQVGQD